MAAFFLWVGAGRHNRVETVPTSFCRIFIEKETLPMKRIMVSGLGVALLLGVVGCGPTGWQAEHLQKVEEYRSVATW